MSLGFRPDRAQGLSVVGLRVAVFAQRKMLSQKPRETPSPRILNPKPSGGPAAQADAKPETETTAWSSIQSHESILEKTLQLCTPETKPSNSPEIPNSIDYRLKPQILNQTP